MSESASCAPGDELDARRRATAGVSTDHTTRTKYPNVLEALEDAERVASDLVAALPADQLLASVDELEFLAKRLRQLLHGCIRAVTEEGT